MVQISRSKYYGQKQKIREDIRGRTGYSLRPSYDRANNLKFTSDAQRQTIEAITDELKRAGVDVRFVEDNPKWKVRSEDAYKIMKRLVHLKLQHLDRAGFRRQYINLCRDRETGKKIRYRTYTRYAVPSGYEFIGEIDRIFVKDEREETA